MPISGDSYRQVGRAAAGAVSVVAAGDGRGAAVMALTVSSFVTLSLDPPLVMFAIQHAADSYAPMIESTAFGVSLLSAEQAGVAQRFARKGRDKAANAVFEWGACLGVPLIPGALAQIECVTSQIFMSGDHAIVVGLVEGASTRDGQPLLYYGRQYGSFNVIERA